MTVQHDHQDTNSGDDDPDKATGTQASRLVTLARQLFDIVQGTNGRTYAVARHGPAIALPMRGRDGLRTFLAREFFLRHNQAPGGAALTDAICVLEGLAQTADQQPVNLRVATTAAGHTVIDLGTTNGQCIVVDPDGWQLATRSPVLFRRTTLTSPLPIPQHDGTLDPLRQLLNVDEPGFRLIVAWLLAALIPDIPHPILALIGEQGTAKSTAAELVVSLIDPSPAPLRSPPEDMKRWAVAAAASWTVAIDNISTIPAWFSDTLCKAVTGDGIIDRALYTDDDVSVLTFKRALVLTSIDAGRLAGDLAERLLPVELNLIDPHNRRPASQIAAAYDHARPQILGALLDLFTHVRNTLPTVTVDQLPRMADFARLLAALDHTTGWTTLTDYIAAAHDTTATIVETDPIARAVTHLIANRPWTGTATELLAAITPQHPPRNWPANPRALSGRLKRIAPALRATGTDINTQRHSDGTRVITLRASPSDASDEHGNFASFASETSAHPF